MMLQALAECPEFASEDLISDFIHLLPKTMQKANTQELCETFAALAKIFSSKRKLVGIDAAEVIAAVVAHIREKINEFTMLDLARVCTGIVMLGEGVQGEDESKLGNAWAATTRVRLKAGKVHGQSIEGWDAFLDEVREKMFARMRTSDELAQIHFSVVIRVFAYIANTIPPDVEEKLVLLAKDQVLCFDSHDVNISLWSIAQLQDRLARFDRGVISMIIRRGVDIVLTLQAHACSNCVWGLATISCKASSFQESTEFLRLIEDRVITLLAQNPDSFQIKHVKNMLWGMARLQYKPTRKLVSALLDRLRCISSEELEDQWRGGDPQLLKKALKDLGFDSTSDRNFFDLIDSIAKPGLEVLHVESGDGMQRVTEKADDSSRLGGRSVIFVEHGGGGGAGRGRPVPSWKTRPAAQTAPASVKKEEGNMMECKVDGGTLLRRMANEGQPTVELRFGGGGGAGRGRPVPAWQTRPNAPAAPLGAQSVDNSGSGKHHMDESSGGYPPVKRLKPILDSEEHLQVAKGSVPKETRKKDEERKREEKEQEDKGEGKERDETDTERQRLYEVRAGNRREGAERGSGEGRGDVRDCDKDRHRDRGREWDRERECDRRGNEKGHSADRRQQRDRDRDEEKYRESGRQTDRQRERTREWSQDSGGRDRNREERGGGLVQIVQQRERAVSPLRGRSSRDEERDRRRDRVRDSDRDRDRSRGHNKEREQQREMEQERVRDSGGRDRNREVRGGGLVETVQQRERAVSPLRGRSSRDEERDRRRVGDRDRDRDRDRDSDRDRDRDSDRDRDRSRGHNKEREREQQREIEQERVRDGDDKNWDRGRGRERQQERGQGRERERGSGRCGGAGGCQWDDRHRSKDRSSDKDIRADHGGESGGRGAGAGGRGVGAWGKRKAVEHVDGGGDSDDSAVSGCVVCM